MKKILLLIAAMGVLLGAISCSDDDEPKHGDGVFTVNTPMINHIVNQNNGDVLGMSSTHNKLTIDTIKHQASVELTYNDGSGDKTLKLSGLTATATRLAFYVLKGSDNSQLKNFSGYVDFNEGAIRYAYTTTDGIRVISTIADVFFLKTQNTITYLDTTKATTMENVMYQFTLNPSQQNAIVKPATRYRLSFACRFASDDGELRLQAFPYTERTGQVSFMFKTLSFKPAAGDREWRIHSVDFTTADKPFNAVQTPVTFVNLAPSDVWIDAVSLVEVAD